MSRGYAELVLTLTGHGSSGKPALPLTNGSTQESWPSPSQAVVLGKVGPVPLNGQHSGISYGDTGDLALKA